MYNVHVIKYKLASCNIPVSTLESGSSVSISSNPDHLFESSPNRIDVKREKKTLGSLNNIILTSYTYFYNTVIFCLSNNNMYQIQTKFTVC